MIIIEELYINSHWITIIYSYFDIEKNIIYQHEKWQNMDCIERFTEKIQEDIKLLINQEIIDIIQLYS